MWALVEATALVWANSIELDIPQEFWGTFFAELKATNYFRQ